MLLIIAVIHTCRYSDMGPRERSLSKNSKIIMLVPPLRGADGKMHAPSCHGWVLAADATRATRIGPKW
jgi:hypothetical protein